MFWFAKKFDAKISLFLIFISIVIRSLFVVCVYRKRKGSYHSIILFKFLKQFCDSYLPINTKIINESIIEGFFPSELKLAEVTLVFKKLDYINKENYGPVNLLSHMSSVFERILYNQRNYFMKHKLSNILTGFWQFHSVQHSLLIVSQKWKRALDDNMKKIFMEL